MTAERAGLLLHRDVHGGIWVARVERVNSRGDGAEACDVLVAVGQQIGMNLAGQLAGDGGPA